MFYIALNAREQLPMRGRAFARDISPGPRMEGGGGRENAGFVNTEIKILGTSFFRP